MTIAWSGYCAWRLSDNRLVKSSCAWRTSDSRRFIVISFCARSSDDNYLTNQEIRHSCWWNSDGELLQAWSHEDWWTVYKRTVVWTAFLKYNTKRECETSWREIPRTEAASLPAPWHNWIVPLQPKLLMEQSCLQVDKLRKLTVFLCLRCFRPGVVLTNMRIPLEVQASSRWANLS